MTVTTTFGGVSNVLVSDGTTSILIDGFFTRPSLPRLFTRIAPDRARIRYALEQLHVEALDAVLVSHSHADHALDAPVVADLTGASLVGSESTRQIAIGYGVHDIHYRTLTAGDAFEVGPFTVTPVRALHSDGDRVPGDITQPLTLPARLRDFRTGECFSFHVHHPEGDVFVHPTANFIPDALTRYSADVVYLGAGGVGRKPLEWIDAYWHETIDALGARAVRPIHWDAFWRPLTKPLTPLPRRLDRLDTTLAAFDRLAGGTVDMRMPQLWASERLT